MFNFEMVCDDGIFQICDDIFSEKLTEREAKYVVRTFYENLKNAKSYICSYKDISFNICTFWCNEEEKENILFNINIIENIMSDMAMNIFDVFYNIENTCCPKHWSTFNNTVVALIDYKNSLFK